MSGRQARGTQWDTARGRAAPSAPPDAARDAERALRADAESDADADRIRLFGAAYRMLGSALGAEEVLRDAPEPRVRDVLAAAMSRSETVRPRRPAHPWAWLPEPVLTGDGALGRLDTPQACAAVGMPRLIRLERLAPVERAAYVLHEVFGYRSAETAEVLDLPEGRCRTLRRRARRQVRAGEEAEGGAAGTTAAGERRRLAADLVRGVLEADQPALEELLADDVVAWSDGGAHPGTVRRPIVGVSKVGRFLAGLRQQSPPGLNGCVAEVNGGPAAVATVGGALIGVLVPEFGPQGLTGLRLVSSADRLEYARRQWAQRRRSL